MEMVMKFTAPMRGISTKLCSTVAVIVGACLLACGLAGCTPAQQHTALQVVTAINARLPEVQAAADTVAATVAVFAPADAALITVGDTAFDASVAVLQALTKSYMANPSATTLQQIQAALNTLETNINTATLNATGIKDAASQRLALAALKGLLTVVTIVFAMIAPTETTAMLEQLRDTNTIHLARMRRYMDERELKQEADNRGISVDAFFGYATAQGF